MVLCQNYSVFFRVMPGNDFAITYAFDRVIYETIADKYQAIADVPQGENTYSSFGLFLKA
jgi:hypothetical protein